MTTATSSSRSLTARYASECPRCGENIAVGEPIEKWVAPSGRKMYAHCGCSVSSNRPAEPEKTRKSTWETDCARCGCRINKGDILEHWVDGPKFGKSYRLVHVGCKPIGEQGSTGTGITQSELEKQVESIVGELIDRKLGQRAEQSLGGSEEIAELAETVRDLIQAEFARRDVTGDVRKIVDAAIEMASKGYQDKLTDHVATVESVIEKLGRELEKTLDEKRIVELHAKRLDGTVRVIEGIMHECFPKLVKLARARKNIMLVGPTGSGKTHTAAQLADVLDLYFGMISCSAGMSEGQILGRLIPVGEAGKFEFVGTEFLKCYEEGGVFLFDEFDAADENLLLLINAALANGRVPVPNRPEQPYAVKHENFVCIVAANTWGLGADREYCGRNQLDAATLNRFQIGMTEMDYDRNVEKALCPCDTVRGRLDAWRQAVLSNRLHRVVSTRFYKDAHDMVYTTDENGEGLFTLDDVDQALTSGWSRNELEQCYSVNPALRPA